MSESSLSPATARYGGDHPVDEPGRQTTDLTSTEPPAADPGSTGHNNADPDPAAEAAIGLGIVVAVFRNRETVAIAEIDLLKW